MINVDPSSQTVIVKNNNMHLILERPETMWHTISIQSTLTLPVLFYARHIMILLVPTCMCSFVDFQIFRSGEYFPTSGERAWERFLARVHTDVVDEFVLGLKRFPFSWAVLPEADVVALLGAADMLHGHMSDHLVHGAESPVASLFGSVHLVLVYPFAG